MRVDNLPGVLIGDCCSYCMGPLRRLYVATIKSGKETMFHDCCLWCEDPRTKRLQKIVAEAKSIMPDFSFPKITFDNESDVV